MTLYNIVRQHKVSKERTVLNDDFEYEVETAATKLVYVPELPAMKITHSGEADCPDYYFFRRVSNKKITELITQNP